MSYTGTSGGTRTDEYVTRYAIGFTGTNGSTYGYTDGRANSPPPAGYNYSASSQGGNNAGVLPAPPPAAASTSLGNPTVASVYSILSAGINNAPALPYGHDNNGTNIDCDVFAKKVLDDNNLYVTGFPNPNANTCKQDKVAIAAASNEAFSATAQMTAGNWYLGVNEGHMFFVKKNADNTFSIADASSDHPAASGLRPNNYNQSQYDSIFGINNGGAIYVPIHQK